jgi:hypothetical protein
MLFSLLYILSWLLPLYSHGLDGRRQEEEGEQRADAGAEAADCGAAA